MVDFYLDFEEIVSRVNRNDEMCLQLVEAQLTGDALIFYGSALDGLSD